MPIKFEIGDATLYLGDGPEIIMTLDRFDLLLTDPPYGIGAATKAFQNPRKRGSAMAESKDYGDSDWDQFPPADWALGLMRAKSKEQIIFGGNFFSLPPARCLLVWDKDTGDNAYADCEVAWTNLDKPIRLKKWTWHGMRQELMGRLKEDRVHPTQKPVQVIEWCITQASDPKTIVDPYMGSGTTGVACANLGRKFVGIEIDPKYFDIACVRIEQAYQQQRLFA